ncbi:MAG TPA: hypothetical protein VIC00_02735 [Candidatus Acidoferrales bacterium]
MRITPSIEGLSFPPIPEIFNARPRRMTSALRGAIARESMAFDRTLDGPL